MANKKTHFCPFTCVLSWLTMLALLGLVFRPGDSGLSHKSLPEYKLKQEKTIDSLCFELQEEDRDAKSELPLNGPIHHELKQAMGFISELSPLRLNRFSGELKTKQPPYYIFHRSLII